MPYAYVPTLVLLAVAVLLLVLLLVRAYREVRRFQGAQRRAARHFGERAGLLKARVAGLRVALAERRRT